MALSPDTSHIEPLESIVSGIELLLCDRKAEARNALSCCQMAGPVSQRRGLTPVQQMRVFLQDRFTCRYCGQRTLFVPVLRAVSAMMPDVFPYHAHWKMSECHIAYWQYAASIDHIVPVARGGSPVSPENLATNCYKCNSIKQHWLLDELRWELVPVGSTEWDGLSSRLPELCQMGGIQNDPYFARWIRLVMRTA